MSHLSSENLPLLLAVKECLKDLGMSVIIWFLARVSVCVQRDEGKRAQAGVQKLHCVWSEVISRFMK